MPSQIKTKIRETALTLLRAAPSGLRWKELHRGVCEKVPGVSPHTITSELHTLRHTLPPGSVEKGLYRYVNGKPSSEQGVMSEE